jgi:hypothetical protein
MTDTTTTPGTRGHTRSTWRDVTHLRGLLMKLIRMHPDAERDELQELYLAEAKGPKFHAKPQHEALIDEALRRAFDNDYALAHQPARPRRPRAVVSDADLAAADQRLQTIILLDLIQPNGKKLRDCTGTECGEFGGWLIKIRDRVGAGIVGEVLSEAEIRGIRKLKTK